MSRVLVTGGAGFIGSHVVERFLEEGYEVHVIDNLSSGKESNLSNKAALHVLDITSEDAKNLIRELAPERIVHMAAQISVTRSMREPVYDVNVNLGGILNILSAFDSSYMPFMTFVSTGGAIYGEQLEFPAKENHRNLPTSVYGLSKRCSELYLDLWARQFGLKYGVVRLANVYGPRQDPYGEAGVVAIFSKRLLNGEEVTIFGTGEQTRDFVYVKDVARAVARVSSDQIEGIFNIGNAKENSVNQLYQAFCSVMGIDRAAHYEPARAGEQLRSVIDPTLAKETFGWEPKVTLQEGIKETLEWFRDN